jgi:hypothetical protein
MLFYTKRNNKVENLKKTKSSKVLSYKSLCAFSLQNKAIIESSRVAKDTL